MNRKTLLWYFLHSFKYFLEIMYAKTRVLNDKQKKSFVYLNNEIDKERNH